MRHLRYLLVCTIIIGVVLPCVTAHAQDATVEQEDERAFEVETNMPVGPILLGSFGLVTVALGASFGWQAWNENDDFNFKSEPMQNTDGSVGGNLVYPNATKDLANDIETHALVANILMFGGAAVVIGSVLWWLFDPKYHKEKESSTALETAKWSPTVGAGRVGLIIEF